MRRRFFRLCERDPFCVLVFNRRAPKTVLDLAKNSLGRLRELPGQEGALQGHNAVPKPEVGELNEIKDEDEEAVLYADRQPVKRSRPE